jgi:hypothetical protein
LGWSVRTSLEFSPAIAYKEQMYNSDKIYLGEIGTYLE